MYRFIQHHKSFLKIFEIFAEQDTWYKYVVIHWLVHECHLYLSEKYLNILYFREVMEPAFLTCSGILFHIAGPLTVSIFCPMLVLVLGINRLSHCLVVVPLISFTVESLNSQSGNCFFNILLTSRHNIKWTFFFYS